MLHQDIDTLQNDIHSLFNEKCQLQQFVSRFKNIDSKYLQIKSIAEEVVDRLLAERKSLLSSALVAVVEALRMNPDRYDVIYDSKYDNDDNIFDSNNNTILSISSSSSKPQNYYYNEYREGILEIANRYSRC
jgi:chorismate mutase